MKNTILALILGLTAFTAYSKDMLCNLRVTGTYMETERYPKGAVIHDYGDSFSVEIQGKVVMATPTLYPTGNFDILATTVNGVTMKIRPTFDMRYYIEDRNRSIYYKFESCEEL